jgi:hypothetical protein
MKRVAITSDESIKANLVDWLNNASRLNVKSGKRWYKEAQGFAKQIAKRYNIDRYKVAGVVSALSPNNKWERNKIDAEALIKAFVNKQSIESVKVCTYSANKRKAWRMLSDGSVITAKSPKTHAFAMNVGRLSAKHVTIDKWHVRACLLSPSDGIEPVTETVTPIQYRRVEAITAQLAEEKGLKAYQLQAIIWVTIKEAWKR